ncbi:hypothetical protein OJF2_12290 [Aquisphaera giovannonii]|uniref:GMT-like wHTH domain-containing protein n=1 Tax=Aquisphaera giovannonii TaxID=406548 RepID=A0A5B9VYQ3_9BACT|nr:three-Cys-motif partner protein TcmP [Aquisphaera giovannonii]QEH32750.1 hypothetical protein OJF2_12290 [Aquisphaera giovannonii]
MAEHFFEEQKEQSQVKTAIVSKYFWAWAKVITSVLARNRGDMRIAYVDLFAGPGRYEDGAKSTPLLILEQAIAEPAFRDNLVAWFNDKDAANTSTLLKEIKQLPGIDTMERQPKVYTNEVGTEIVKMFEQLDLVPTLFFVDPWGYKGLSLRLINSVLKDWACECIFFFNYTRINMGLPNERVDAHMDALFGAERAAALRQKIKSLSPDDRELAITEEICEALVEMGGKYVLPFRFKNEKGTRTKHQLIFVSKHPLGYKIMKDVMAKESSSHEQGVPTFEYNPATTDQPLLFEFARPLDDLEGMLLDEFAGRTMTMAEICEEHHYGRRYIAKNYKDVLTKMEQAGKITGDPPHTKRRKIKGEVTCADATKFTFPPKQAVT